MKKTCFVTAALASALMVSGTASAQLFGGVNGNTVLGAGIGAGLGGIIGSQIAGNGVRSEGSAIGAVVGGLAGAAIANSTNQGNYYGGYVPAYGPGVPVYGSGVPAGGNNGLVGAGVGAALGGVLGSQLAGHGARTEGSAIGAVLGGLAGYGLTHTSGQNSVQGSTRYGSAPSGYGTGYSTFGAVPVSAPTPLPPVQYIQGQSVVESYTVPEVTTHVYQPAPLPAPVVRHVYETPQVITNTVIHHQPVITKTVHVTRPEYRSEVVYENQTVNVPTASTRDVYEPPQVVTNRVIHHQPVINKTVHVTQPEYRTETVYEQETIPPGTYCYGDSTKRYDSLGRLITDGTASSGQTYSYENVTCNK